MDVCLKVQKCYDYGHGVAVVGVWYNLAFENTFSIGFTASINIAKTEEDIKPESNRKTSFKEWEMLDRSCLADECYRYSRWKEIQ